MKQVTAKSSGVAQVDWSTSLPVDRSRLETGGFKFPGLFEYRGQERISQRELGQVVLSMRLPRREEWVPVRLWDFTSISFGVHFVPASQGDSVSLGDSAAGESLAKAGSSPLHALGKDDEVELRIQVSLHQTFQVWCQVKNVVSWKNGIKIGLRRMDVNPPQSVEIDRRETFRLPISPALSLRARVKHPFIFGYWSVLQVSDVNRKMGLSFVSADSSILLFEGMELQIHFELASHRESPMTVRVSWVQATEANQVRFGVVCMGMGWRLHNGLCDFLIFSRHWTPARLRKCGFRAQQVKGRLRFRTVKTMEDYSEVLHLRRDAYVAAGKKAKGTRPEEMAGPLDGISRILMAQHQETIVGSVTFTFPTSEEMVLDSQAGFPGRKYPVNLPPKANLIEVSRLCIHHEYRGTDLLQGLFEHGIKHFLMSDRHWLLTSAVTDMLPAYERIGFKRLKASYKHPALNNLEHHLILAHRDSFLYGKGMNLLVWNSLFGNLIRHILDRGLLRPSLPVRVLVRLKLKFGQASKRLLEGRADRAFRKHLDAIRLSYAPEPLAEKPSPGEPEGMGFPAA